MTSGMVGLYEAAISNRMNRAMMVLSVFGSIFLPLTFIVGVYGMNFKYMPELKWRYGYPAVWIVMIAVAVGLLWFFRRQRWLTTRGGAR
jgi:magnesium transporter